jgi:hypothetical protein
MSTGKTEDKTDNTEASCTTIITDDWLNGSGINTCFWDVALDGNTLNSSSIQRIIRCVRYLRLTPNWKEAHRLANVAWANGAVLASTDGNKSYLDQWSHLSVLGQELYDTAQSIYPKVYHPEPVIRQRLILKEAVAHIGPNVFGSVENLFVAALHAGNIGIQEGDLQTGMLSVPDGYSSVEEFIMNLCLMDSDGLNPAEQRESVAWIIGSFYRRNCIEHRAITEASAKSVACVRQESGGVLEFLADGFVQGGSVAKQDQTVLTDLLEEVAEPDNWTTLKMFWRLTGDDPGNATAESAWQAMLLWLSSTHGDLIRGSFHLKSLYIARHCYDFLFWFGLIRQLIRDKLITCNP